MRHPGRVTLGSSKNVKELTGTFLSSQTIRQIVRHCRRFGGFLLASCKKTIRLFANSSDLLYICSVKEFTMKVTFNEGYLEELYTKGKSGNKKYRFQPQIVRGYQKAVKFLIQAQRIEDLFPFKSLHFEALHGDREGRFSVKANDPVSRGVHH